MSEFEQPVHEFNDNRLNRLLGKVGLVYGSGVGEFGLQHTGCVPLYRRSALEAASSEAQAIMLALQAAEERSEGNE